MNKPPEDSFDVATRIAAGDDGSDYDIVAIALHWLTALLVVVQFVMAVTWDYFAKPTRQSLESVHISLGVLLTGVIVARLAWRSIPGHRRPAIVDGWIRLASKAVHYLLYALLVVQAALGFGFRWAQGHAVSFFGLFRPLRRACPAGAAPAARASRIWRLGDRHHRGAARGGSALPSLCVAGPGAQPDAAARAEDRTRLIFVNFGQLPLHEAPIGGW